MTKHRLFQTLFQSNSIYSVWPDPLMPVFCCHLCKCSPCKFSSCSGFRAVGFVKLLAVGGGCTVCSHAILRCQKLKRCNIGIKSFNEVPDSGKEHRRLSQNVLVVLVSKEPAKTKTKTDIFACLHQHFLCVQTLYFSNCNWNHVYFGHNHFRPDMGYSDSFCPKFCQRAPFPWKITFNLSRGLFVNLQPATCLSNFSIEMNWRIHRSTQFWQFNNGCIADLIAIRSCTHFHRHQNPFRSSIH